MEGPGTLLRTTERVAGFRSRYLASVLRLMGPSVGGRFRFIETQSACGRCSADAIRRSISPLFSGLHRSAECIALGNSERRSYGLRESTLTEDLHGWCWACSSSRFAA